MTDAGAAGTGAGAGSFAGAAEEATRLADAIGGWLASAKLADWLPGGGFATGSADCRLCPVCQAIGLLRTARPEVVAHLEDAMGSVLSALRLALECADRPRAGAPGFERIDIG